MIALPLFLSLAGFGALGLAGCEAFARDERSGDGDREKVGVVGTLRFS